MNLEKVLLLIGSPKSTRSTSESLGTFLCDLLNEEGVTIEKMNIRKTLDSDEGINNLFEMIDTSDLIILSFPLYIDSLPAPVTKALELIANNRQGRKLSKKPKFMAIANNGFPEASQNDTALAICHCFAKEVDFEWIGGLALGMGAAINGIPLKNAGGRGRHAQVALQLTAKALIRNDPIPLEAKKTIRKPMIPSRLYRYMGNRTWKQAAKKFGVYKNLKDTPYV